MVSTMTAQDQSRSSPLLRIPLELRFAIYEELLAPGDRSERLICRCGSCQEKQSKSRQCANPKKRQNIFPAILATNKTIHDEANMILYGKNVFQIVCPEISTYPTNKKVPELCGVNSLVTSEGASRSLHMKLLALSFSCYAQDELFDLPNMWSWLEPKVLAYYPGVRQISLNLLRVNAPYRILILMIRKDLKKPENDHCAPSRQAYWDRIKMCPSDSNWEMKSLCDAILPAERRPGLSEDSSFAIQSIQWSGRKKSRNLEKLTRGIFLE